MFDQRRSVPFEERFGSGSFEPGQTLTICGSVQGGASEFHVNISSDQSGPIDQGEITFHLSARFAEEEFVFNHKTKDGKWGDEERASLRIKQGEHFDLHIRAFEDRFQVWANRKVVHNFKHRLPLNTVRRYEIGGQIEIHHALVGGTFESMPFAQSLSNFRRIDLQGIVDKNVEKFNIDIKARDDTALTISSRFDEEAIVRNALVGGAWGAEEREGGLPLNPGQIFDITLINQPSAFEIHINGKELGRFVHRVQPNNIDAIEINGDIELTAFRVG